MTTQQFSLLDLLNIQNSLEFIKGSRETDVYDNTLKKVKEAIEEESYEIEKLYSASRNAK